MPHYQSILTLSIRSTRADRPYDALNLGFTLINYNEQIRDFIDRLINEVSRNQLSGHIESYLKTNLFPMDVGQSYRTINTFSLLYVEIGKLWLIKSYKRCICRIFESTMSIIHVLHTVMSLPHYLYLLTSDILLLISLPWLWTYLIFHQNMSLPLYYFTFSPQQNELWISDFWFYAWMHSLLLNLD